MLPVTLVPASGYRVRPLQPQDVPLVVLTHNDARFIPSLLRHYRRLGVTRFICVDDQSEDATRDLLFKERDVDVWLSPVRFRHAARGKLWREALFALYGSDRWYLNIDSDEYLIYDDCFNRPITDLIGELERRGENRLAAPMIDLYPPGPIDEFAFDGTDGGMPWEIANCFDRTGYHITPTLRHLSMTGGPRRRVFGEAIELMKYPLLKWDQSCSLGVSIHQPTPYQRNFPPISGVLLHFKLFSDLRSRSLAAVKDKQYFDGAAAYERMLAMLEKGAGPDFNEPVTSASFEGPEQMIEYGFMRRMFGAADRLQCAEERRPTKSATATGSDGISGPAC
ncbi:glycosyltransferase family 2 protein [Rhizobium terrae]|uniref:glycosyltransferase family 2 protein n=1 Tax=Rhizobium terrae TaxID=2171756 RepID=UPI0038578AB5